MKNEGALILVVDDEIQIRRYLKISLEKAGYKVVDSESGEEGLARAAVSLPDVIILDLGLPDMDGLLFVQNIRQWSNIPIIVLTVKDSENDKVVLLDNGADDYLTKPFSINELCARIRVVLRNRTGPDQTNGFYGKRLEIQCDMRIVKINGNQIKLTPKEYGLLILLSKNPGKVLTQNSILRELWGLNHQEESQYLRFYIMQLRKKIEIDPKNPKIILTEPGVGYRFIAEEC